MKQQLVESNNNKTKETNREGRGRIIALSRNVYRLVNTDVFYVESESSNNDTYYFVKFKPDVLEWCSCPDNSMREGQMRCKHIWSIEFAIRMGTLKDTDRLPTEAKVRKVVSATTSAVEPTKSSYKDDDYSF